MLNVLIPLLPKAQGLLPKWQLIVSVMAFFNSAQNMYTLDLTRRVYSRKTAEVTALQARTFAVWTFLSAIVRVYCAYHINEKTIYDVTMWSYAAAFLHFTSEWLVFRSTDFGAGLLGPLVVAPTSFVWMSRQYSFYVQQ